MGRLTIGNLRAMADSRSFLHYTDQRGRLTASSDMASPVSLSEALRRSVNLTIVRPDHDTKRFASAGIPSCGPRALREPAGNSRKVGSTTPTIRSRARSRGLTVGCQEARRARSSSGFGRCFGRAPRAPDEVRRWRRAVRNCVAHVAANAFYLGLQRAIEHVADHQRAAPFWMIELRAARSGHGGNKCLDSLGTIRCLTAMASMFAALRVFATAIGGLRVAIATGAQAFVPLRVSAVTWLSGARGVGERQVLG